VEASWHALASSIKKYRNILIIIKGSPDPDAIASSYAISVICRMLGVSSTIIATKELSLPENRAFVHLLDIPMHVSPEFSDYRHHDAYIVTDFQSAALPEAGGSLPCAAHIDHHEPPEEETKADFLLRNTKAGSTSTILALLLKQMSPEPEPSVMTPLSTALLYGIYTDTDKYSRAGDLDYEAMDYLSKYSDHDAFNRISSIPLSREALRLLKTAISSKVPYKDWLIAGVGYVDAVSRDSIAIIADFLLKRETYNTVIVFAAIEENGGRRLTLDASIRTTSESLDLNGIIKNITPEGGARKFKGAYQINLDYFSHYPDRTRLWEVVSDATIELLKKSRDELYLTELKGFYQTFKKKMRDYFS
jgi:nanoRNase/pAp phosphatase (c-di-AMP/oligoRNAs hydrolase)